MPIATTYLDARTDPLNNKDRPRERRAGGTCVCRTSDLSVKPIHRKRRINWFGNDGVETVGSDLLCRVMAGEGGSNGLPNGRSAIRQAKSRRSLASRRSSGSRAAAAADDAGLTSRDDSPAGAEAKAAGSRRSEQRPPSRAVKPRRRAPARTRATPVAAAALVAAADEQAICSTSLQQADRPEPAKDSSEEPPSPRSQRQEEEQPQRDDGPAQDAAHAENDEQEEVVDKIEEEEEEEAEQQQNRRSVGVLTDADCLGPCEPGTHVNLDGIVWQETANGVLVVNVTWRGKTYMGTLLDATKHDWAPPRLQCASPSSDTEARMSKSRIKRRPTLSATFQDINERKLRRQCRSSGSQSESHAAVAAADRATPACAKRRAKPAATAGDAPAAAAGLDSGACGGAGERSHSSAAKRPRSSSYGFGGHDMTVAPTGNGEASDVSYLLCPEPGCTRKYRQTSSLRHHLRQAHPPVKMGDDGGAAAAAAGNSGSSDAASAGGSPDDDVLGNAFAAQQRKAMASARSSVRLSKRELLSRSSSASPEARALSGCKSEGAGGSEYADTAGAATAAAALATPADVAEAHLRSSRASSRRPRSLSVADNVEADDNDKDVLRGGAIAAATGPVHASLTVLPSSDGPARVCALSDVALVSSAATSPKANGERSACTTASADACEASLPSTGVNAPQPLLPTVGLRSDGESSACRTVGDSALLSVAPSAARVAAAVAAAATALGPAIVDGSRQPKKPGHPGPPEEVRRGRPGDVVVQQLGTAKGEAVAGVEHRIELEARGYGSWPPAQQLQPARRPGRAAARVAAAADKEPTGEVYSDVSDEGLLAESDARPSEFRAATKVKDEQQLLLRGQRPAGCAQFAYPVVAVSPRKADRSEIAHAPSAISSDLAADVPTSPFLGRQVPNGLLKRPGSREVAAAGSGSRGSSGGGGNSSGAFGDAERLAALESYYRQQQQQQFGLPYYPWPGLAPLSPYDDAAASSFLQLMDWRAKALERHSVDSFFSRAATPSGGGAGLPDGGFCQRSGWEPVPSSVVMPLDMHASRYEVLRESIELKSQMSRLPSPRGGRSGGRGTQQQQPGFSTKPLGGSPCDSESSFSSSSSSASHRKQQRVRPAAASPTSDRRAPLAASSPQRSVVALPGAAGGSSSRCGSSAPSLPADGAAVARRPALDARLLQQWSRPATDEAGTPPPPPVGWSEDRVCLAPAFASRRSPLGGLLPSAATAASAGASAAPKGSASAPAAAAAAAAGDKQEMVGGFTGSASADLYPHLVPPVAAAIDSRTLDSSASRLRQHKIHELGDVAL